MSYRALPLLFTCLSPPCPQFQLKQLLFLEAFSNHQDLTRPLQFPFPASYPSSTHLSVCSVNLLYLDIFLPQHSHTTRSVRPGVKSLLLPVPSRQQAHSKDCRVNDNKDIAHSKSGFHLILASLSHLGGMTQVPESKSRASLKFCFKSVSLKLKGIASNPREICNISFETERKESLLAAFSRDSIRKGIAKIQDLTL